MEIIAQAVRVIDYENNSVQRRNVNMMPKFKDYIEQLIVHVSNNVSIREYHTQSTRTEVIAGILEIAGNLETPDAIEEKIDSIAERFPFFTSINASVISAICFLTRRIAKQETRIEKSAIIMDRKMTASIENQTSLLKR